jgi:hypothetical protein
VNVSSEKSSLNNEPAPGVASAYSLNRVAIDMTGGDWKTSHQNVTYAANIRMRPLWLVLGFEDTSLPLN